MSHGPTAVAALVPRRRAVVLGEIQSVVFFERPFIRTDTVLADGTAAVTLCLMGRAAVPGMAAGRRVMAEGTPASERGVPVMRNPIYSFAAS